MAGVARYKEKEMMRMGCCFGMIRKQKAGVKSSSYSGERSRGCQELEASFKCQ